MRRERARDKHNIVWKPLTYLRFFSLFSNNPLGKILGFFRSFALLQSLIVAAKSKKEDQLQPRPIRPSFIIVLFIFYKSYQPNSATTYVPAIYGWNGMAAEQQQSKTENYQIPIAQKHSYMPGLEDSGQSNCCLYLLGSDFPSQPPSPPSFVVSQINRSIVVKFEIVNGLAVQLFRALTVKNRWPDKSPGRKSLLA